MDKEERKDIRNAAKILEEYFAKHTTPELDEAIQQWLINGKNAERKDAAFGDLFDTHVGYREVPSRKTFIMFNKLSRRLGFAPKYKVVVPLVKRTWFRVAAVLLPVMVVGGAVYMMLNRAAEPAVMADMVTVATAEGVQKHIILPDSSQIWLNGASTVTYPAGFAEDRVVELSGEAYFSVRKADGKQFSVKAGDITATVLGTEFNIRAYETEERTEVYLGSGSIEVGSGRRTVRMKPNEMLTHHAGSAKLDVTQVDESAAPQWRTNLEFEDMPLGDVLKQIGERYGMKIELHGSLPEDRINVDFDYDASPEMVLSILHNTLMYFTYEINGDTIKITAR